MSIQYPNLPQTVFPNDLDTFVNLMNIVSTDGPLVRLVQQQLMDGNFSGAQETLSQIQFASKKILTAEYFNKMRDCILALERFYKTDIGPYLDDKQNIWENFIKQFGFYNVYSPSTQYVKNNYVLFNDNGIDKIFIATQNPPVGILPTNKDYWRELTIEGMRGPTGEGGTFLYDWVNNYRYSPNDIVVYQNKWWVATIENQNSPPYDGSPEWKVLVEMISSVYPLTSVEPTYQNTGQLWFEIITQGG